VLLLAPLSLATLAVAAPWYLLLARDNGADFVWREFMAQNFARFGDGAARGHLQPWHYYLTRIWGDIGLWSALVPGALAWRFRARIWADRNRRLLWLWFVALFGFFTLAATKREVYLLPAYAALAALIGDVVAQALAARDRLAGEPQARLQMQVLGWAACGVAVLVAVVGLGAIPFIENLLPRFRKLDAGLHPMILALRPAAAILALALAVAAWWLWRALRRGRPDQVFAGVVAVHACAWVVAMLLVFPRLDEAKSYRVPAEWLKARVAAGDDLGFHYPAGETTKRCGFLFYGGMRLRILATPDELATWLEADPRHLAVLGVDVAGLLTGDIRFAGREIHRFNVGRTAWVVWGRRSVAAHRLPP
jgi:4-amino-4-deoxy-L-arabinose transferase-like glycosyltransferase